LAIAAGCLTTQSAFSQEQGGYESYGPTPGMNMNPVPGNPFIGSWTATIPIKNGSAQVLSFSEYLPNGNARNTSIIQGGPINGARMQTWGKYSVKQIGQNRYVLTFNLKGHAPREMCMQGGGCQNNDVPATVTDTDEIRGPGNFHFSTTVNGVTTEGDAYRSPVPRQLLSAVGPRVTFNPPPQSAGGSAKMPTMPTLHPYQTPGGGTYHVPGQGGTCDDAQQRRICSVNNGSFYRNSQGCLICVSGN